MAPIPQALNNAAAALTEHLILDGSKIAWYMNRVRDWEQGRRFPPITVDMALTRRCNFACRFCYAMMQANEDTEITQDVMARFLEDSAEIGVRGVSLVSDGESTLNPCYAFSIRRGHELGLAMASGTNGLLLTPDKADAVLPYLTYLRINFSGGTRERYAEIMGVKPEWYDRVVANIRHMVAVKERDRLPVTLGMQLVLMPQDADELLPFAQLAVDLGVDYAVIKHCSDDEDGSIGVDYGAYERIYPQIQQAEALSNARTQVIAKWSKLRQGNKRPYARCYGAPFIIQISGSGLVAPCGMLFNAKYAKLHIGNITQQRWKDIVFSDRYWEVMEYLASPKFDARRMCGALCLQDRTNVALDKHRKGIELLQTPTNPPPLHMEFI